MNARMLSRQTRHPVLLCHIMNGDSVTDHKVFRKYRFLEVNGFVDYLFRIFAYLYWSVTDYGSTCTVCAQMGDRR